MGFGIVGPLSGVRPSWRWLGLAGLVGGGPTFLGTILGYQVHSGALELCFYALAGGAVLYVIGEIWNGVCRYRYRTLGLYLLAAGFLVGVATDLVVSYGGADASRRLRTSARRPSHRTGAAARQVTAKAAGPANEDHVSDRGPEV